MSQSHLLSKSTFIKGCQCPKALYLHKHRYQLRDQPDAALKLRFGQGHQVGNFARKLFPGGKDASPAHHNQWKAVVDQTARWIEAGETILYEAAFVFQHVLIYVDILKKEEDRWIAYEVKSSFKITDTYIRDVALQYYVLRGAGIRLQSFMLVTMNPDYEKEEEINLNGLFKLNDLTGKAIELQPQIAGKVRELLPIATNDQRIEQEIGSQCFQPYRCDFIGHCWGKIPPLSLFDLTGISKQTILEKFKEGKLGLDAPGALDGLSDHQKLMAEIFQSGNVHFKKDFFEAFFKELKYPVAFLDFELFMPAIPVFKGSKPFQHFPFMYSMVKIASAKATPEHFQVFVPPGQTPEKVLAQPLQQQLKGIKTLVMFDKTTEMKMIAQLGAHPIIEKGKVKTVDLMDWISNMNLFFPGMKGSFSIKAMAADLNMEEALNQLVINNGYDAASAYQSLFQPIDLFAADEITQHLKEYSRVDTEMLYQLFMKAKSFLKSPKKLLSRNL
jgi:hypothetical protein